MKRVRLSNEGAAVCNQQIMRILCTIKAKIDGEEEDAGDADELLGCGEDWTECYKRILESIGNKGDFTSLFEESSYEDLSSHKGFSEIVGLGKAKMQLHENVVLPLRLSVQARKKIFTGIRGMASNVLLHGPPGTGKTSLVRAAAREAGANLICVKPSMVLSKYHGESEGLLSAMFKAAIKTKSIIFFDEFDSIASSRSRESGEEGTTASRRLLSELLLQLNQQVVVGAGEGAMVIAATNRVIDLDEAIVRRFPVRIFVGELEDVETRVALIKHFLHGVSYSASDEQLKAVAGRMHNWSGSDVEQLVKEASLYPLRRMISMSSDTFQGHTGPSQYTQELQAQVAVLEGSLDSDSVMEVTAGDLEEAYNSTMAAVTADLEESEPEPEPEAIPVSEQQAAAEDRSDDN